MRDERLYLDDVLESAAAIGHALLGVTEDDWIEDNLRRDAVMYRLIIIGEAAGRLSKELRDRHPEIQWPDVIGFRNFAVHQYFAVDWDLVWRTARRSVPELAEQILQILRDDFGEGL